MYPLIVNGWAMALGKKEEKMDENLEGLDRPFDRLNEQRNNDRIDSLTEENKRLKEEIETLIWNLAGCSTFALGYGLDEGFDEKLARAALYDVRKLALHSRQMEANLLIAREALCKICKISEFGREGGPVVTSDPFEAQLDCAAIAKEAFQQIDPK